MAYANYIIGQLIELTGLNTQSGLICCSETTIKDVFTRSVLGQSHSYENVKV